MLNPLCDENEGMHRAEEGKTSVITACSEGRCEGNSSYDLSWRAKAMVTKRKKARKINEPFPICKHFAPPNDAGYTEIWCAPTLL